MITPLTTITSRAAHLPETNIDTDIIYPARYLLRLERAGLADCAFHDRRFAPDGSERADFPLHRPGWREAQVIVAGPGFGCGSSRENAVWALVDLGIRLVIAPDFGDIFRSNAVKNGLLALRLPPETCAGLGAQAEAGATFHLDMTVQTLAVDGARVCDLGLSADVQQAFLNGWDETDIILNRDMGAIAAFEQNHRRSQPWLFSGSSANHHADNPDKL